MKQEIHDRLFMKGLFLGIAVITGFIFIVVFSSLYVSDAIRNNNACGCVIPIPYMIIILSSLGLFVGSLSYYIIGAKHVRDMSRIGRDVKATLRFLPPDERVVIDALISQQGSMRQSAIAATTGLDKVRVHRVIGRLESKRIVEKTDEGACKRVSLIPDLIEVFG
ncbi:MarR family transcriptional regulator [Candidatus Woesearchaeota archaeon]|nr:MarR family transcriptional regulator [Candidatus Woesearchaeota archaeon]